jgi:transcriptional regulator with XRE-family HTH domain
MVSAASIGFSFSPVSSGSLSDGAMDKDTGLNPQICGYDHQKFTSFLRSLFPRDTAKTVARLLNVSPRTVENWLSGVSTPGCDRVFRMIGLWGVDFICAVMASPPDWACDALARAELAELERRSAALHSKLREAREG